MKAVSDIFSPATGKIIMIHDELKNDPSVINKSAEGEGWIAEMTVDKPNELGNITIDPQGDFSTSRPTSSFAKNTRTITRHS